MSVAPPLHAFAGYGIELEYMIVDRETLSILPLADELLRRVGDDCRPADEGALLAWSNELVLHLVELKNVRPCPDLAALPAAFQTEVQRANRLLAPLNARLMPTAMHPWMDPRTETRLWPHEDALIYSTYDRIFDCRQHGFANLQSMHVNLPFADDAEFARLHAAVRLVLPILPALAASSPIAAGAPTGMLDFRMEAYRKHTLKIPSIIGSVIPDPTPSRSAYEAEVLERMYRDVERLDPEGVLRHEWLNCRGAIPRFDRSAIEIRVIDLQECPPADVAIAEAAVDAIGILYDGLGTERAIATDALAEVLLACIRDAEKATIDDQDYLSVFGFPGRRCEVGELWWHLLERGLSRRPRSSAPARDPLRTILQKGPLARRILRAVGADHSRARLQEVYRDLCDCLDAGRPYVGSA